MSRRHFAAIARAIRGIADQTARYAAAQVMADVCAVFSPRFDLARFLVACGAVDSEDARR